MFAAVLIASVAGFGQFLGVQPPQEPAANPKSMPLPRRLVGVHPVTILSGLLSQSSDDRKRALQQLGDEYTVPTEPIEAGIRTVCLDADPEPEFILKAKGFPPASHAYVFEKDERGWWIIGDFIYGYHWDANDAERFLEVRQILYHPHQSEEILVRDFGGGSELSENTLTIYAMYHQALYPIFEILEDRQEWIVGTNRTEFEHRDISFPEPNPNGPIFLLDRYEKRTKMALEDGRSRSQRTAACAAYRWDAMAFEFVEERVEAKRLCR